MSRRTLRDRVRRRVGARGSAPLRETTVVGWLVGLHFLTLAVVLAPVVSDATPLRALLVFVHLTFTPGLLVLVAIDEFELDLTRGLYAVGLSTMAVMVAGAVANVGLPLVGVDRPLGVPALAATTTAMVIGLAAIAYRRALTRGGTVPLRAVAERRVGPTALLFVLLVPLTVLAVESLQRFETNLPIVAVLTLVAVVPLGATLFDRPEWYPLGVWGVATSLLYHATLSNRAYGASSVPLHIMEVKRWTPGIGATRATSTSLLPNGVLYPSYATLIGVPYHVQTSFVNPLLVSLLPVALFVLYRRYVRDATAFLGVGVFVFAHPFYRLYPGGGRVATPVIFLALLGLVVADDRTDLLERRLLGLVFAAGIVVSHYGTSYLVMFVFVGAFLALRASEYLDPAVERLPGTLREAVRRNVQVVPGRRAQVLSGAFVLFFATSVTAWYIYTSGGSHYSLPRHVARTLQSFFGGDFVSGSTASRARKSYGAGSQSIRLSRFVYFGLAGLMGVGLAAEGVARLHDSLETPFDDTYLAVSAMLLATFGSTILLPVGWGGGRPMMITFTFVGVFAVLGILTPARWAARGLTVSGVDHPLSERRVRVGGHAAFGILLAVFLTLNTGVVAATLIGGVAPMNVPLRTELDESRNPTFRSQAYVETDVRTHAWLLDHSREGRIYGDVIANGQTDKYRTSIALAMEREVIFPYDDRKPRGYLDRIGEPGVEPGYVLLLGHNVHLEGYAVYSSYNLAPLAPLRDELERRNRIYTSGESHVYFAGNRSVADDRTGDGSAGR